MQHDSPDLISPVLLLVGVGADDARAVADVGQKKAWVVRDASFDTVMSLSTDDLAADVVLVDVDRGAASLSVCRRLAEKRALAGGSMLGITAKGYDEAHRRAIWEAGATGILFSPLSPAEAVSRIGSLLSVHARAKAAIARRDWLEEQYEVLRAALVRADQFVSLGMLSAGVAHELNNLVVALNSAVFGLREIATDQWPAEQLEDLDALETVGQHVTQHARQMLQFSRPGSDHTEDVDLGATIDRVAGLLRLSGRFRYVSLEIQVPQPVPPVAVSQVRLEQVLINFLANAADALEGTKNPRVRVAAQSSSGRVRFSVEDNGPGIAPEHLSKVFEPYFTTKAEGRGTGLGLPVVKEIVESYGGTVSVHSALGAGTTFMIDLPAAKA